MSTGDYFLLIQALFLAFMWNIEKRAMLRLSGSALIISCFLCSKYQEGEIYYWLAMASNVLVIVNAYLHGETMRALSRAFACSLQLTALCPWMICHFPYLSVSFGTLGWLGMIGAFPFCFSERIVNCQKSSLCFQVCTFSSYIFFVSSHPLQIIDHRIAHISIGISLTYYLLIAVNEYRAIRAIWAVSMFFFTTLVLMGSFSNLLLNESVFLRLLFIAASIFINLPNRDALTLMELKGMAQKSPLRALSLTITLLTFCMAPLSPLFFSLERWIASQQGFLAWMEIIFLCIAASIGVRWIIQLALATRLEFNFADDWPRQFINGINILFIIAVICEFIFSLSTYNAK
jgi:hypothetical protein